MLQIPGEGLACGRVFGVVFSAFLRWMKADDGGMFSAIRSVHFVGVGGTAMASVAAAMQQMGIAVTGSDQNVYPPMSTFLESRGIEVCSRYAAENLDGKPDLVVIGNALSRGNAEVETVLERKLRYVSLPELLKEFFLRGRRSLVVAGTHGKTTTAALLAWVFERSGLNPGYLIGGLAENLGQGARFTDSPWFIIEGDEYDTAFFDKRSKFVHYLPEVAILNNLEFDHADIFEDLRAIQTSFRHLIRLIPRNGLLLANGDDPNVAPLLEETHCPVKRFGFEEGNAVRACGVRLGATASEFEIPSFRFHLNLVGELNVRNALAVVACAKHCGLSNRQIQVAFDTFQGIKRRMEIRGVAGGVTVIDDFGHHPTAIRETLRALRIRYGQERLWALFEPRSNTTRRSHFQRELAEALALADRVVVAPIARSDLLPPEQRLDLDRLLADIEARGRTAAILDGVDPIVSRVVEEAQGGDVICVFSNGGFGGIHQKLLDQLAASPVGVR
jgi:UDP-N-acetylmuramate: L-alanyl-gamma-D-glutamyl-meso-diaminopimelate ligase